MNKRKWLTKSVNFYKLYLVNICMTVIFICLIAFICSTFSSNMILNNMTAFNEDMIIEKSAALDERVKQLDETVQVVIGEENVFRFLMTNHPDYEKPTAMLKMIRHFQNLCSNNSLIEGIRLIDVKRKIIINEKTKKSLDDESIYEKYKTQSSFVLSDSEEDKKLEYVKIFEPVRGEKDVYIILTLNIEAFSNNLLLGNEIEMMKSYLLTTGGDILSVDGTEEIDQIIKDSLMKQTVRSEKLHRGSQNLMLYKHKSEVSDISLAVIQDYTYLSKDAAQIKRLIIISSLLMIVVASIIIYLCSLYVYKPLKLLGYKLQSMGLKQESEKITNEYSLIEHVVNELRDEKEYALPSVVKDSVSKLVTEPFDEERFEYLKRLLNQSMEFDLNVLVVVECETNEFCKVIMGTFRTLIKQVDEMDGFFTNLTSTRLVGIFNISLDYEDFLDMMKTAKEHLEVEGGMKFTCCVSGSFKNRENMNLIYTEMLKTLERTFFTGRNTFICKTEPITEHKKEYYSKEMENRLTGYVMEGNLSASLEALRLLTENLSTKATDIQYTRFVYFQICNDLVYNVLDMGRKLPKELNEKDIFESVFQAHSIQELVKIAETIVKICVDKFIQKENDYSPNVEKAITFILEKYMKDLSLDDVANAVFLSSGYLSIIFKDETGYTVLEYITYIRMQEAKNLVLQTPVLKVKDIAEQLGYNNVQSFIRHFKKYYGETPMAFRQKKG